MYLEQGQSHDKKIDILVDFLKSKEAEFVAKGTAMTSYIASIARVLEKGGVDKFEEVAWAEIQGISEVESIEDFDDFHADFVERVTKEIKTNKGEKLTYGQAQKPINVFLKAYVDRSKLPDLQLADRLRPWLHVPLDSEMMTYFYEEFRPEFDNFVRPIIIDQFQDYLRKRGTRWKPRDEYFLSLARILTKADYYSWQNLFRTLYPERPILLDTVYALRTRNLKVEL